VHAAAQHTPSAQKVDAHWLLRVHDAPLACAGWHVAGLPPHHSPETHSASELQPDWQPVPEALHSAGVHVEATLVQAPEPLHRGVVSAPAPEQVAEPHVLVFGGNWQAPAPLHVPPHVPVPVHSSAGSWPAGMAVHVPIAPARLQAWQTAPQAPLQQTPSLQLPLAHSFVPAQIAPLAFFATQAPAAQ
jgi:hypothetical protein